MQWYDTWRSKLLWWMCVKWFFLRGLGQISIHTRKGTDDKQGNNSTYALLSEPMSLLGITYMGGKAHLWPLVTQKHLYHHKSPSQDGWQLMNTLSLDLSPWRWGSLASQKASFPCNCQCLYKNGEGSCELVNFVSFRSFVRLVISFISWVLMSLHPSKNISVHMK